MGDFNAIRGKSPSKTDRILEYLVTQPNLILSPKEVAQSLGFNLQTTVTVLNRLALEGAISKKGRGQFCYDSKIPKRKAVKRDAESASYPKIDKKTAALIYSAIYKMASDSTGAGLIDSFTGLGPDDFDENAPVESIQNLVRALIDLLGKEIADDIVSIALKKETSEEGNLELEELLKT